jgi:hypothetical protein
MVGVEVCFGLNFGDVVTLTKVFLKFSQSASEW